MENAKAAFALALGHMTYHVPRDVLAEKLESHIIRTLLPLLRGLKVSGGLLLASLVYVTVVVVSLES